MEGGRVRRTFQVGLFALGIILTIFLSGCPLGIFFDRDYVSIPAEYDFRKQPGPLVIIPFAEGSLSIWQSPRGKRLADLVRSEMRKKLPRVKVISSRAVLKHYRPEELERADWAEVAESVGARYIMTGKIISHKRIDLDAPHPFQSTLVVRVSLQDGLLEGDEVWSKIVEAHYPPVEDLRRMTTLTTPALSSEEILEGLLRESARRLVNNFYKRKVKCWEVGRPEVY